MLVAREIACLVYVDEDNRMKNKNAGKRLRERESEVSSEMSEQNKQNRKGATATVRVEHETRNRLARGHY